MFYPSVVCAPSANGSDQVGLSLSNRKKRSKLDSSQLGCQSEKVIMYFAYVEVHKEVEEVDEGQLAKIFAVCYPDVNKPSEDVAVCAE